MEQEITTKSLQGISDLTLVAPIKQGFIPALETRTYTTRLRAVLKTLHTLRQTSREHSLVRPFSDGTDRIRTISDLRMAILEDEQKLLLSVSFDRPWEPYLRIIWRDVGTLLDVIFCNCETYVTSDHTFAQYGEWIRNARTNVQFFYRASALTFDDVQYLRQTEKLLRETSASELDLAKLVAPDPEQIALKTLQNFPADTATQGMQALSVLYRLVDQYPVGTYDGEILLRASRQLLRELGLISKRLPRPVRKRFAAQLAWFEEKPTKVPVPTPIALRDTSDVQSGILNSHRGVTHGCMLLLSVSDPHAAADFLDSLAAMVSYEAPRKPSDRFVYVNVAFTREGLCALGVPQAEMDKFPHEFLEGMQERAGLIGDVRGNHPRNWALPERNWPARVVDAKTGTVALVQLATVHIVVHMYTASRDTEHRLIDPLKQKIEALMDGRDRVQLLSVQPMRRYIDDAHKDTTREHFGFVDGISQPVVGAPPPRDEGDRDRFKWSNFIGPGELLLGYTNDRGDAPTESKLGDNGTFLVVRKLRQFVDAFQDAIKAADKAPGVLEARMVGRTVDGDSLVPRRPGSSDFDYEDDKVGAQCPFSAHIRRVNPRLGINPLDGRPRTPRIMRRGMSYGPLFKDDPGAERGLMFMAYNASIAEQFEVIQRWISGGNSTGVLSDQSDPLLGVPQLGETRVFRYYDSTSAPPVKVKLDDASRPFVRLEWGAYLFAPSKTALNKLRDIAKTSAPAAGTAATVEKKGVDLIEKLQRMTSEDKPCVDAQWKAAQWKAVLEDTHARSSGESEAVWAAIRSKHNGVLHTHTEYGVLVASHARVAQVLENASQHYSVSGYGPRLKESIGEMYLGLDDTAGSDYQRQSASTNAAIMAVREDTAFERARYNARRFLKQLVGGTKRLATSNHAKSWELTFDIKEVSDYTLARLCEDWIGPLSANKRFKPGGWRWNWKSGPPLYPGHFTAPSRYLFQPNPSGDAEAYGKQHGQAVLEAMKLFVIDHQASPPATLLGKPIFDDANLNGGDLRARTLVGVMMGFLPTVDGNLRSTLNEWLGGGTERPALNERLDRWSFWDLQNAFVSDKNSNEYAKARDHLMTPLLRTMQLRPVPELLWRTAVKRHKLGDVEVKEGDKIVIASVSATQESLATNKTDIFPVFGGERWKRPAPTHACPGYEIGIGVLLGIISALMAMGPVRPTPAPLTLSLSGTIP